MKKSLLTIAIVLAVLTSCSKPESFDDGFSSNDLASGQFKTFTADAKSAVLNAGQFPPEENFCSVMEYELIAGRTSDVGDVLVGNDGTSLYIKIFSEEGFQNADENVKIWIGTEMPFEARPSAGQFPHKYTVAQGENYLHISFSLEELEITCEDQVYIIIHADVPGETAFAGIPGTMNEGAAWWYHILFSLDCCSTECTLSASAVLTEISAFGANDGAIDVTVSGGTPPYTFLWSNGATTEDLSGLGPGTYSVVITDADGCNASLREQLTEKPEDKGIVAFARKTFDPMVHCFLSLDMNSDGIMDFDTWGWTNGALGQNETAMRTYELFINAEGCDVSEGKKVGEVKLLYSGGTATATFTLIPGYTMSETSLYIGNDMLPKDGGVYTTDPAKYPYKHAGLGGVETDSYVINGLTGSIYVIAHAIILPE